MPSPSMYIVPAMYCDRLSPDLAARSASANEGFSAAQGSVYKADAMAREQNIFIMIQPLAHVLIPVKMNADFEGNVEPHCPNPLSISS